MKASLTFRLPEEQNEFSNAINGDLWRGVLRELVEELRRHSKHGVPLSVGQLTATPESCEAVLHLIHNLRSEAALDLP